MGNVAVSALLAEELAAMATDNVPIASLERVRLLLLDTVGAMLAGAAHSTSARVVRKTVTNIGATGYSTVMGETGTVASPWAALCNGVAAHSLDLDDAHRYATGYHPGATVIPAVIALAEERNAKLSDVIVAIAVGYEAGGRIGRAINPSHRHRGFHSTGTVGVFGAAAGAAKILNFDSHQMLMSLGVAGSMSGGIFAFLDGMSPTKHLHAGHAAHAGVLAAMLVSNGFEGPETVLEHRDGFFHAYADTFSVSAAVSGLGDRREVMASYFKAYTACGHAFSAIEAAIDLRSQVTPADIVEVTIDTYRAAAVLNERSPRTLQQGQFSLPFLVAVALLSGRITLADIQAGLNDPLTREIAEKCVVREMPEMTSAFPDMRPGRVTITVADGSQATSLVEVPLGMPERPLSTDDVVEKFHQTVDRLIGDGNARDLEEFVLHGSGSIHEVTRHRLIMHEVIS